MSNTMSVDQVSVVLRDVIQQATGSTELAALDTNQLLTLGRKALTVGRDPVLNAISMVISRTIFSNRPYNRKFRLMMRDEMQWGNYVRKLTVLEKENDLRNNQSYDLVEDGSIDQYKVNKPNTLQLNFMGQQTYEIVKTIFDVQLDTAFTSAEEFAQFVSMVLVYVNNKIEKIHEETARATIAGAIAGKISGSTSDVIHLVTEYKAYVGDDSLSKADIFKDRFGDFMKWVYGRVNTLSDLMTEYSIKFHTNLEDGLIMRHTPKELQMTYILSEPFRQVQTRVLGDMYRDEFMKLPNVELVNFWQNIDEPDKIHVKTPRYLGANGEPVEVSSDLEQADVFGIIADYEAMGYNPVLTRTKTSPYNAAGEYYNQFWKFNERHFVDYTENMVVLLLD